MTEEVDFRRYIDVWTNEQVARVVAWISPMYSGLSPTQHTVEIKGCPRVSAHRSCLHFAGWRKCAAVGKCRHVASRCTMIVMMIIDNNEIMMTMVMLLLMMMMMLMVIMMNMTMTMIIIMTMAMMMMMMMMMMMTTTTTTTQWRRRWR